MGSARRAKGWPRRLRAPLCACLVALAVAGLAAATASAGTYTVWSCRGPDGEPVAAGAWTLSLSDALTTDVSLTDGCATGGALELELTEGIPFPSPSLGLATLAAPPGAPIVDYTLWRSIETAAPNPPDSYDFAAAVRDKLSETQSRDRGCSTSGSCQEVGDPDDPFHPDNELEHDPKIAIDAVQLLVACATAPCDMPPGVAARVRLFGARVVLDDVAAPSAPRLSGSLAGPEPVTGPGVLVVESSDQGGGVAATTLSIDGDPPLRRASNGHEGSCVEPYTLPQPCPTGAAHVFVIDTTTLSEGTHSASGTVVDAGGNATSFGPLTFTVDHPAPPRPPPPPQPPAAPDNGTPAVERPRLRLDRRRVEHAARRPARLTGSLTTRAGAPIAGARLAVEVRELGSVARRVRRIRAVTTSARGRFAIRVRGGGAQRVSVSFVPTAGDAATAVARATVRARAALSIARSPARVARGERVVFRGRLRGAGAAAGGAVVELQAVVSGRWRTVAAVRTRKRGRYRWRYRFRYVRRDAIFSFRAVVRRTPGWPWPALRSRRIRVRVDGRERAGRGDAGDASTPQRRGRRPQA